MIITKSFHRHLASNPFQCDCNLMWIAEFLEKNPVETSGAKCVAPEDLQRERLGSLKQESARCWGTPVNPLLASCETTTVCPLKCKCEGKLLGKRQHKQNILYTYMYTERYEWFINFHLYISFIHYT